MKLAATIAMIRFGLGSLLIYVSAVATIFGLNVPAYTDVDNVLVLPCIATGFADIPRGFEDRIPGPTNATNIARPRLPNELTAKPMDVTRGWPLSFQHDRGFLFELDQNRTWFGIPDTMPASLFRRIDLFALTLNCLIVLIPVIVLERLLFHRRWKRQSLTRRDVTMP
jgi:hypothetical protein